MFRNFCGPHSILYKFLNDLALFYCMPVYDFAVSILSTIFPESFLNNNNNNNNNNNKLYLHFVSQLIHNA